MVVRDELQDVERIALPQPLAARLAEVSQRRLNNWGDIDLLLPTVERRVSARRQVKLYNYVELMSLLVITTLLEQKVPVRHIREVVQRLREREGYGSPLTELRFAVVSGRLYFQREDGVWEDGIQPNQIALAQVLNLEPLRARLRDVSKRSPKSVGSIERRPGAMGGKELVGGTRVPVATIERYIKHGFAPERIVEAFPAVTLADVELVARSA